MAVEYVESDDATTLSDPLLVAGIALCRLGSFEPAAVIFGKADAMTTVRSGPDWALDIETATDAALLQSLVDQQAAALAARGAALEFADAVAYLRAQAESVLQQT